MSSVNIHAWWNAEDIFLACLNPLFFFWLLCFNWRIIALQHHLGLCHTSTWISHRYTCVFLSNLNCSAWFASFFCIWCFPSNSSSRCCSSLLSTSLSLMLPLLSITFVGSLLTLEWRGREKQVIQIPKHDIACDFTALLLQWNLNVSFWTFQTCKLYTPEYLITELRHWALGPGYVSWNLPPNLIFWRWAALHSLLLLVAQTVPVEDTCFHSSTCLPNSREIIIRSVSLAYLPLCAFSFQGG